MMMYMVTAILSGMITRHEVGQDSIHVTSNGDVTSYEDKNTLAGLAQGVIATFSMGHIVIIN